jgi:Predicted permeases
MNEIFHLINEMSPYLLLGFLIAGLMHAFIPGKYYTRYLAKPNFRSVLNAALFGVPLPLCSCGVIPTAMSLRKEGASKGAVASFLIATPQTGVDSIIATYSLMGLPFAIIRPIVAFITALFGGSLVNRVTKKESQRVNESTSQQVEAHDHCHEGEEKAESCCCHHHEEGEEHCHHAETKEGMTFWQKIVVALRYAFVDMVEDIGKWLVVGLVIAALITVLVPDSFFAVFKDNTWLSMLLVLVISIPMYICATGSIPIAVALMLKGLTPGSALVLLMAGPAANMASILVIHHRLGVKTLVAYLVSIIGGAVASGFVIDYLLPRHWFTDALVQIEHCTEAGTWFTWACTALLVVLLINAFVQKRHNHSHCHCH